MVKKVHDLEIEVNNIEVSLREVEIVEARARLVEPEWDNDITYKIDYQIRCLKTRGYKYDEQEIFGEAPHLMLKVEGPNGYTSFELLEWYDAPVWRKSSYLKFPEKISINELKLTLSVVDYGLNHEGFYAYNASKQLIPVQIIDETNYKSFINEVEYVAATIEKPLYEESIHIQLRGRTRVFPENFDHDYECSPLARERWCSDNGVERTIGFPEVILEILDDSGFVLNDERVALYSKAFRINYEKTFRPFYTFAYAECFDLWEFSNSPARVIIRFVEND